MGKAGKYTYPEYPLGDIIESLFKIKEFFGESIHGELEREAIADAWNLTYGSGTFNPKIAALIQYGFAERAGSGKVKLTQLAMDVVFPINNSDIEAKQKAFSNIQLFTDIYEAYGDKPTIDQIKWLLRQKGNAEPAIAEKKAPEVRKIYIESVKEVSIAEEREKTVETGLALSGGAQTVGEVKVPEGVIPLRDGDVVIWLPPTFEAVEIARSLIDHFERTRIKKKRSVEEVMKLENEEQEK